MYNYINDNSKKVNIMKMTAITPTARAFSAVSTGGAASGPI